jgi:hypothetical protein
MRCAVVEITVKNSADLDSKPTKKPDIFFEMHYFFTFLSCTLHFHWYSAHNRSFCLILSSIPMKMGKISTNKTKM